MADRRTEEQQKKQAAIDVKWYNERIAQLNAELGNVPDGITPGVENSPRIATFLRECMTKALRNHAESMAVMLGEAQGYRDRDD